MQISRISKEGKIGILYKNYFIQYDPTVGIDDTETTAFQELDFRKVELELHSKKYLRACMITC